MKFMKDTLGDRLKEKFENSFRITLPQRTYGILRIDGKSFHTFTKRLPKPYCEDLARTLDMAAIAVCSEMMGTCLAYGQSDEYSFLFTDFEKYETQMWFNGNIQKIVSVSSSIFTAEFNREWSHVRPLESSEIAMFDARVFVIPNRKDVFDYFHWRQVDAFRNSLNMFASCYFSHKELMGKSSADKHEMLHNIEVNWNNCNTDQKHGRVICKIPNKRIVTYTHKKTKKIMSTEIEENVWNVDKNIPVFNREKEYLEKLIP